VAPSAYKDPCSVIWPAIDPRSTDKIMVHAMIAHTRKIMITALNVIVDFVRRHRGLEDQVRWLKSGITVGYFTQQDPSSQFSCRPASHSLHVHGQSYSKSPYVPVDKGLSTVMVTSVEGKREIVTPFPYARLQLLGTRDLVLRPRVRHAWFTVSR
jgi:hypothetical protein